MAMKYFVYEFMFIDIWNIPFLAIMNNIVMNISIQVFVWIYVSSSLSGFICNMECYKETGCHCAP